MGDRVLGECRGARPGPTVVAVGAIHGNEPAGVAALTRVVAELGPSGLARGRLVALVGNLGALAMGQRGRAGDLNRRWTSTHIAALHAQPLAQDDAEDGEQRALLAILEPILQAGPVVLVDLHTTSAGGPPFTLGLDTPATRRLARLLPFPLVLGLLESVAGTIVEWAALPGHAALALEAGQHLDPQAETLHRAAVWALLAALGCVGAVPADVTTALAGVPSLPPVVRLACRHPVHDADGFVMQPGFVGFEPVRRGDLLAHDVRGPIYAPLDGALLMPLYQAHGSDGFFIVQPVP